MAQPHLPEGPSILSLGRTAAEPLEQYLGCGLQLTPDLGDDVSSEQCVLGYFMQQVGGHEVDKALDLMHHCVHVGHLQPVLDSGDSAWPNHPVDFFMKFLCNIGMDRCKRLA